MGSGALAGLEKKRRYCRAPLALWIRSSSVEGGSVRPQTTSLRSRHVDPPVRSDRKPDGHDVDHVYCSIQADRVCARSGGLCLHRVAVQRTERRRNSAAPATVPPLIAVAMAIRANPAMAVAIGVTVGMESVIGAGRDGRAISHRMAMSVGPPRPSRPAAHCDRNDACRGAGEWRDLDCRGGNGGQAKQHENG